MNERLKIAIIKKRIEQAELAERTQIHDSRLSGIINGRIFPNLREMTAIAGILGLAVAELWDLNPSQPEVMNISASTN